MTPWTAPPSRRRKEPPIAGPLPESLELVLGNQIYIAKEALSPGCAIGCFGWRRFRTRSSTRRRRCVCRPMTSRASSPVPKTIRSTSVCRAAVWRTCKRCCRT